MREDIPLARRLEDLWQSGGGPDVHRFLAEAGSVAPAEMVAVLGVDQWQRWQAGERVRAEEYLGRYPALAGAAEHALELVYGEFVLREGQGETPTLEEYQDRFPHLAGRLRQQVELHRALASDSAVTNPPGWGTLPIQGASAAASDALPAACSRYRPLSLHARGGLGEVYLAEDNELPRQIALKRIRPQYAAIESCRRRFLREAEITALLEHPGIVPVHGLVHDAHGQPHYVMRFVSGESLKAAIDRYHTVGQTGSGSERLLEFRQLLRHFVDVCNTVAYAHSKGVIHRDLKPNNVMLGAFGETLIVDWGLAKRMDQPEAADAAAAPVGQPDPQATGDTTQPGQIMGTPGYMAPEQAAGRLDLLGPANDIYTLGATLYVLLAGKPPFQGSAPERLLSQLQCGEFPPPRHWKPAIPRALEAICLKAMALQPEKRYATALDLAADLEHWLADEPVAAYRDPLPARLGRWSRRHKPLVAGAAALLLTAVVALIISTVQIRQQQVQAQQAKEAAEQQRDRAERNLGLARRAVDDTITKVAEEPLLKQANFHDLRKKLLALALPYYQEFVQQQSDDPELEAERGRAYFGLALVRAEMGEREEAVADYRGATAIFARLEATFPDQPVYRRELAWSRNNLALLLGDLGRHDEAEREYRAALSLQKELSEQFPDVPSYRQHLAHIHSSLGLLLAGLVRRRDEAEKGYRAALALQEKLAEQFPDVAAYRLELARSHDNLGNLLAGLGRSEEAKTEYQAALPLQQKLAEQFPDVPDYRRELAASHNNLGVLLSTLNRPDEADKEYRAALTHREKLAEQFPAVPAYRQELANSHNSLGNALAGLGRHGEAEKEYRAALTHWEKLAERFPTIAAYAVDLGGGYVNFGTLLGRRCQPEAALPWFDKAIARLQPVLAKDRRLATARLYLRNAHGGRALALTLLNRSIDALRDWDRAIELAEGPLPHELRWPCAVCLARAGEHARAMAEANALIEEKDESGPTLYAAACVFALAAASVKDDTKLCEQHAGRAVTLLRQAQQAGCFKEQAKVAHLKKDSDLRALRGRPDYQALLKELETPAKP